MVKLKNDYQFLPCLIIYQLRIEPRLLLLAIIKAYAWLKKQNDECRIIGKQLLRSATSTGANVRESMSGQSKKDYLNKLEIALKECRESQYWLELLIESELVPKSKFQALLDEANEIGRVLTASTKTVKEKL